MNQFYGRKLFQKSSSAAYLRINLAQLIHETRTKNEVPVINVVSCITFQVKLHLEHVFFLHVDQYFMSGDHFIVLGAWSNAWFFKPKTMSVN